MAFAAARMIMPKDKQARKASAEMPGMNKNRSKVRFYFPICIRIYLPFYSILYRHVPVCVTDLDNLKAHTVCFRDLAKLNLQMVVRF